MQVATVLRYCQIEIYIRAGSPNGTKNGGNGTHFLLLYDKYDVL